MQPPMLFPRAWAYISQEALLAFRATSHAEFASKMDPLVIDVQPIGLRVDFHELRLNLFRRIVVARRKPQLMGDAEYMRIDGDALRVSKRLAHNAAMASGVPKRANNSGVTLFTAASVH